MLCLVLLCPFKDEHVLINFFIDNQTQQHCVLDRQSDKTTISVAATGFGYYAWAVGVEEGLLERQKVLDWINASIDYVVSRTPAKNRGWLFHFLDPDGNPKFNKEVSTIDTTLFWLGARKAAAKLADKTLIDKVEGQIKKIDKQWMLTNNKRFSHGLIWEDDKPVFIKHEWDDYNEGFLIYKLFDVSFTPRQTTHSLPLFVYYYLTCFYPDEKLFQDNLKEAVGWQIKNYGYCGVTACDGPDGYVVNDPDVISPLSVWACSMISKEALDYLKKLPCNKTTPAFSHSKCWQAADRLGIDDGSCLMMLKAGLKSPQ